jgi:hypothetical protein
LPSAVGELFIGFWAAGSWRLTAVILGGGVGTSAFPRNLGEASAPVS